VLVDKFIAKNDLGLECELHAHYVGDPLIPGSRRGCQPKHITTATGERVNRRAQGEYELPNGTVVRSDDPMAP
jgi:hypothetical protein